ncbi:unnamed protein product [Didymodactylos carnosus]|uniref:Sulfotransferase domain-containing protein n=1 Tax=Didymodactylos carnosus TaxID=1234261 RepID=A0A813S743_9BILA|nr:unnamed protein product [Didymodactylos carnosus]CAF3580615.1 unnamed protein product [Didymodactylos carnosus]
MNRCYLSVRLLNVYSHYYHHHHSRSLTTSSRLYFIRTLFDHTKEIVKTGKKYKEKKVDLVKLSEQQYEQLTPILKLQTAFRSVNFILGLMGIFGIISYFYIRQKKAKVEKEIETEFKPIWLNLKNFKEKAAYIYDYLFPEQIISKFKELTRFQFDKNDIICSAFPKSGITLIQEIVYLIQSDFNYEQAKQKDISDRFSFLEWPSVSLKELNNEREKYPEKIRLMKTHLPPIVFNDTFKKAKIIYIYRNPKDVCVSLYHFLKSINVDIGYTGKFYEFHESFLIDELYYAPWWRHVNDYYSLKESIFIVSYEELLKNFQPTIRRLAAYLGKSITTEQLDKLEQWCSFESMKTNSKVNYDWFKDYGFVKKDFSFMRKGQIGDWLNYFDINTSKKFDEMVRKKVNNEIQFDYGITSAEQDKMYDIYNKKVQQREQVVT